jgi:drug/metabolite transporter (DMT)-like permease
MNWFTLVGLGAGLFGALAKVSVRRLTRSEPTLRIIFYFGLYTTLLSSIPLLWGWQLPDLDQFLWLLVIAGCTTLGQFLLTRGYARAPAARLGPLTYVGVIFAGAYGYLFWGETPDLKFLAGAILVAAAGLLAVRSGNAAWSLRAS